MATTDEMNPSLDARTSEAWQGFVEGSWQREINVRDFIQKNYTPYDGDASFLAGPTERTKGIRYRCRSRIFHI
jgi:formate C-acetyltransferase